MIGFTERVLYRIHKDKADIKSKEDLWNFINETKMIDELKRLAGDRLEFLFGR